MEEKNKAHKDPYIINFVRAHRILWLEHTERLSRDRMPKMVICRNHIGKKRIERPRNTWFSKVKEDLSVTGIGHWRDKKPQTKKEWNKIVQKLQSGCWAVVLC